MAGVSGATGVSDLPGIDPWDPSTAVDEAARRRMDPRSEQLCRAERAYIDKRRERLLGEGDRDGPLAGLALSGGGIRSATFSLGVMQALAARDALKRFDYLSTVSGGGYIGSSLTWLTSAVAREGAGAPAFGVGPSRSPRPFPYGTVDPEAKPPIQEPPPEDAMLRYLRQHGNYLIPGEGITLTSGIVVVLRGITLNFLVWLPIVTFVMTLFFMMSRWLGSRPVYGQAPRMFLWLLVLAGLLVFLCAAAFAIYSLYTYLERGARSAHRYILRRRFETWLRAPFWAIGLLLLVGSIPFATYATAGWLGSTFTFAGLVSGIVSFVRSTRPLAQPSDAESGGRSSPRSGLLATAGAALLLYGMLLLGYGFAEKVYHEHVWGWALFATLIAAVVTGWFVNLNHITIHRFYRDRLMEAFLPDIDQALANRTAPALRAEPARLSKMCDGGDPIGPYHLINANLVLTNSNNRALRMRGGDNFLLSPLYCGSNATGWCPTNTYMKDEMTLATAMAISGAAANPWAASDGVGLTRNPLVSTLMALMNLRLGYWVRNPRDDQSDDKFRANHFHPGLAEVIGRNLKEDSSICLLSDGGHFENLALYELIRRRLSMIVVCDGTADPNYAFSDLQSLMARIYADFGAQIEFDPQGLASFMPVDDAGYPRKALVSKSAYAIATIIYADGSKGKLIYLNTALTAGLRLQLMGYKGANWDFPDQSTGDQFFDEVQFEAYRELGYAVTRKLLDTEGPQLGLV